MAEDPKDDRRDDPFEEWRKRLEDDPFLAPFFADLDREFERMRESLSRMLEGMQEGDVNPNDPFVYGFSVRMGPDGEPRFDEFGNLDPSQGGVRDPSTFDDTRKPLVDVQEGRDIVAVTAELPGVEKDDINLRAKRQEIVVSVDDTEHRFFKRIQMPAPIHPETTNATYKNGVLDIEVDKAPERDEGTEIEVD